MFDVVVIGSANLDLVAATARLPGPGETVLATSYAEHAGGKGLNQAIAAARGGADVAFVGSFGTDAAATTLRDTATTDGVDLTASTNCDNVATGRALITVDESGENCIVVVPGANASLDLGDVPLPDAAVTLAQLEVPVEAVAAGFRAARAAGRRTVLNPAPVPAAGVLDDILDLCDVVIPNEHELELLGGVDHLIGRGVGTVIVTRGGAGVTVVDASSANRWDLDAFHVTPIDTTGAGDAFCGAFASRLAAGDTLDAAVRYAAGAGALATTVAGAVPSLPRHTDVAALLAAQRT